jgi:hypothetical protein
MADLTKELYQLAEAIADICYNAGHDEYRPTEDSRANMAMFIIWAEEFEEIHQGVEWGVSTELPNGDPFPYNDDYIFAIDKFYETKRDKQGGTFIQK